MLTNSASAQLENPAENIICKESKAAQSLHDGNYKWSLPWVSALEQQTGQVLPQPILLSSLLHA